MTEHNVFKKIAVINDLTGFGRCSLTVELPIISKLGVQCCPVPTSVLSNHSAYDSFYFADFTDSFTPYVREWKKLSLKFDGILTGFYGSARQIELVENFITDFSTDSTIVIVDPIMGDNGRLYSTYTDDMCRRMAGLAGYADIITPNLTELCILTDTPLMGKYDDRDIGNMCIKLSGKLKDNARIVVTGIKRGSFIENFVYENGRTYIIKKKTAGDTRCGTGDVFAAILAADAVNGVEFTESVRKAAAFVSKCIKASDEHGIPKNDGVCFEEILNELK